MNVLFCPFTAFTLPLTLLTSLIFLLGSMGAWKIHKDAELQRVLPAQQWGGHWGKLWHSVYGLDVVKLCIVCEDVPEESFQRIFVIIYRWQLNRRFGELTVFKTQVLTFVIYTF